jgi:hypothetical protein
VSGISGGSSAASTVSTRRRWPRRAVDPASSRAGRSRSSSASVSSTARRHSRPREATAQCGRLGSATAGSRWRISAAARTARNPPIAPHHDIQHVRTELLAKLRRTRDAADQRRHHPPLHPRWPTHPQFPPPPQPPVGLHPPPRWARGSRQNPEQQPRTRPSSEPVRQIALGAVSAPAPAPGRSHRALGTLTLRRQHLGVTAAGVQRQTLRRDRL